MSRTTKIILLVLLGVGALCCLGAAAVLYLLPSYVETTVQESFSEGGEAAAAVGEEIISYTLPAGYEEQASMSLLGMRMVMIGPAAGTRDGLIFMLMSFPDAMGGSEDELRQQMQDFFVTQSGSSSQADFAVVGSETIVINDRLTTLSILEGSDEDGVGMRQVIGPLPTRGGGSGMIMVVGTQEGWDQDTFEQFLQSLH